MKIVTLGPAGTNSHKSIIDNFPESEIILKDNHKDVIQEAIRGRVHFWVPIYNSITAEIEEVTDILSVKKYDEVMRIDIPVTHCLVSKTNNIELDHIKLIYSHPQGLKQCSEYIKKFLKGVELIETKSTADAAKQVSLSNKDNIACICNELAAELNGLYTIECDIQDNSNNISTFIIGKFV